jgi:hypothetical protein
MSELTVSSPGIVTLRFGVTAERALKTLVGEEPETCSSR